MGSRLGRAASLAFAAILLATGAHEAAAQGAPQAARAPERQTAPVRASTQMVVTANPYASAAGREILRAGGGAVDAAIAVQLVLSLVEPQSSGIGGGAFMLYFRAPSGGGDAALTAYEGRETAPAAATPDMFLADNGRAASFGNVGVGGLGVGVPGVLRMLELAHREHGRLPWKDLSAPALKLADEGFEISPRLYSLLNGFKRFARGERFRSYLYDAAGEPHPVGYRLKNPEYAATLRLLADRGVEPFYSGELAAAIAAEVRGNSVRAGRMTVDDLKAYKAHESAALCTPYRQWRVCGPRLPSSGGVTTQQVLGTLRSFELGELRDDPATAIHLVAEASRLAFADRDLYLGDPDFVPAPVAAMLQPDYLARRAALIDYKKALPAVQPGTPAPAVAWSFAASGPSEKPSTSHFSIADRFGDAVAMTTSVQGTFGSQLMVGGFVLNNQLTDFEYQPTVDGKPVANRIEGGKRPLSSMAPTFVLDEQGRPRLLVGSPGGTRIIGFVAQAIIGVVDWKLDVQQAVAAPHFLAQDGPIELEQGTDVAAHQAALEKLGHTVAVRDMNSGLHAIAIDYTPTGRVLWGGVDPRREGVALGD
ncbi:MAG TPA: gamma-glutamyltransferase [Gammaproteobacteria bacterium]|nr:gamma-glutamyltransferase [Gammaproteobacteria bacterium]